MISEISQKISPEITEKTMFQSLFLMDSMNFAENPKVTARSFLKKFAEIASRDSVTNFSDNGTVN